MKCNVLAMVILALCCFGCTQAKKGAVFPKTENVKVNLTGDKSIIGGPIEILKYNDILLINDFQNDSMIWIFDVSKNRMIKRSAGKGKGPNEFKGPLQIVFIDTVLMVQDRSQFKFQKFYINPTSLTFTNIGSLVRIPTDIDRLYPLDTDSYIASGRFEEGRYAMLNRDGKIVRFFGKYPDFKEGEERIPNFPKFMFHQSMFTYNSDRKKLASITAHVLDIIDFSKNQPEEEKRILLSGYDYMYEASNGGAFAAGTENTEIGVTYVCSTSQYIYAIYNPNVENDPDKKAGNNQIWVFDWNGNPIKKIQPDHQVLSMCVEKNNQTVYCMVYAPEPMIASFKIDI